MSPAAEPKCLQPEGQGVADCPCSVCRLERLEQLIESLTSARPAHVLTPLGLLPVSIEGMEALVDALAFAQGPGATRLALELVSAVEAYVAAHAAHEALAEDCTEPAVDPEARPCSSAALRAARVDMERAAARLRTQLKPT